jgi:hypothetical protein
MNAEGEHRRYPHLRATVNRFPEIRPELQTTETWLAATQPLSLICLDKASSRLLVFRDKQQLHRDRDVGASHYNIDRLETA